jgi:hypothetical protein
VRYIYQFISIRTIVARLLFAHYRLSITARHAIYKAPEAKQTSPVLHCQTILRLLWPALSDENECGAYIVEFFKKASFVMAVLTISLLSVPQSQAQTTSNAAAVTLVFAVSSSLTVAASPSSIVFTETDSKHATASAPISVVTSWNLTVGGGNVFTVAYFATINAALTNGTLNIPASAVLASVNGGTAAACTLANVNVAAGNPGAICPQIFGGIGVAAQGTHSDSILLSLSSASDFPVANYAGILTISAQAT